MDKKLILGSSYVTSGQCEFVVWAPFSHQIELHIVSPRDYLVPMKKSRLGYHKVTLDCAPGTRYFFRIDGKHDRPDPASRSQPQGVHGPSELIVDDYTWTDTCWSGFPLKDFIIYELHTGTFSEKGNFQGIIDHLDYFVDLGITAIELMPIAQFPGVKNWGYDGVYPYAVQSSYGGAVGLKNLVNACHEKSLAVILDVVYNHMGPEGNYLTSYGPYFTEKYNTPWGMALNFDGPYNAGVRRFFIDNALYWVTEFHIDALRLDAIHDIYDFSAHHFLEELTTAVHDRADELNRKIFVIAESDLNDARLIKSPDLGGYGMDAQWNDDLHHALHSLITGEDSGYYSDFGEINHMVKAYRDGFIYSGNYSEFRKKNHGNNSKGLPAHKFVVFCQNHDQVGNRMMGERLGHLTTLEGAKLAAAVVLLSPYVPLLFMGEEYCEMARFPYFVDHSDEELLEAVRNGRKEEFSSFKWVGEPPIPDDIGTFQSAKLNLKLSHEGEHRALFQFYKRLIWLRKNNEVLSHLNREEMEVFAYEQYKLMLVKRWRSDNELLLLFHFGNTPQKCILPFKPGTWIKALDSSDETWDGPGSRVPDTLICKLELSIELLPFQCILFEREGDN